MGKKNYSKATCINDRLGLEVGITVGKQYELLAKTQRYITIRNDYGVVTRYWKNFFKLE